MSTIPDRAEYLRRWSDLHGGIDPSGSLWVRGWLSIMYTLARPLAAARIAPDLITVLGVVVACSVLPLAWVGGRWLLVAPLVVVLAAVLDSVDGAVAALTGRAGPWGAVWDAIADRLGDSAFVMSLWILGAPAGVVVAGGALMGLQEYTRARAGMAGMDDVGVVTVWERPSRVIVTALFLFAAGAVPDRDVTVATAGAWAWVAFGVVGCLTLLVVVRRRLHP